MNNKNLITLICLAITIAVLVFMSIYLLYRYGLDGRLVVNPPFLTVEELDEYMLTLKYEDRPTRLFFKASDCLKGGSFNCVELSRFYSACLAGLDIPCEMCYYSPDGWHGHTWCRVYNEVVDWAAILTNTEGLDYGSYKVIF